MKSKLMKYKNYYGSYSLSVEDSLLHGKIEFIRDLITYEAESAADLMISFHTAVDDYLQLCTQKGREPDKPFKGSFNVRIAPRLHEEIVTSLEEDESLNSFIVEAVREKLERSA